MCICQLSRLETHFRCYCSLLLLYSWRNDTLEPFSTWIIFKMIIIGHFVKWFYKCYLGNRSLMMIRSVRRSLLITLTSHVATTDDDVEYFRFSTIVMMCQKENLTISPKREMWILCFVASPVYSPIGNQMMRRRSFGIFLFQKFSLREISLHPDAP